MPTPLEEIKEKIDLVDFIKSYIPLSPAGKNFRAPCPFHQEKTPSFIVSPERQIWHCFGCNLGGDAIKFLMLYEGLEFYEALRVLAEKTGVQLRSLNLPDQKEFNVLYEINEKAKDFYKEQLPKSALASEYLKKRGLLPKTIEEFEIGFAPPGGENLILTLHKLGYNINDIAKAGLAFKTDQGKYLDRFYNRIMFPIYNNFGKPIAFTGRILPAFENSDVGKYVNTMETPLFNKSKVLYGFHKAKAEINHSKTALIVEGQMDFLMTWQSGIKNVVATSGTALGDKQIESLKRLADSVIVSFDKDEAGIKAMERSLDLFSNFDFNVKILDLNGYKDPAEAAEKDPDYLKKAVEKTQPAFVCLFDFYLKDSLDWTAKKRNINHLLGHIKTIKSGIEQSHWLNELSLKSGIEEKVLVYELAAIKSKDKDSDSNSPEDKKAESKQANKPTKLDMICQRILSLILSKPEFAPELVQNRDYFPVGWQRFVDEPALLKAKEENGAGSFLDLRSSYEFADLDEPAIKKEFQDLVKQLKIEFLNNKVRKIQEEMRLAQRKDDKKFLEDSLKKLHAIYKEVNDLKTMTNGPSDGPGQTASKESASPPKANSWRATPASSIISPQEESKKPQQGTLA